MLDLPEAAEAIADGDFEMDSRQEGQRLADGYNGVL